MGFNLEKWCKEANGKYNGKTCYMDDLEITDRGDKILIDGKHRDHLFYGEDPKTYKGRIHVMVQDDEFDKMSEFAIEKNGNYGFV